MTLAGHPDEEIVVAKLRNDTIADRRGASDCRAMGTPEVKPGVNVFDVSAFGN